MSNDARFTKGPWRYEMTVSGNYAIRAREEGGTHEVLLAQVFVDADDAQCEPDARLIAAAPDLYEACVAALLIDESDSASVDPKEIFDFMRAALAKANGSTQTEAGQP